VALTDAMLEPVPSTETVVIAMESVLEYGHEQMATPQMGADHEPARRVR
jgi:hypothetical protein